MTTGPTRLIHISTLDGAHLPFTAALIIDRKNRCIAGAPILCGGKRPIIPVGTHLNDILEIINKRNLKCRIDRPIYPQEKDQKNDVKEL